LQVDNIVAMSPVKLSRREVMKTIAQQAEEGSACSTPPALQAAL
jgi:hypothetical protein